METKTYGRVATPGSVSIDRDNSFWFSVRCIKNMLSIESKVCLNEYLPRKGCKYSRLSLSRNRRDPLKHFKISVLRHIRFVVLREKTIRTFKFHK